MKRSATHTFAAVAGAVIALLATWGSGFLNRHHSIENVVDDTLIRLRAFGLPCGVERWSVKTLADAGASKVSFGATSFTNIVKLDAVVSDQPTAREAPTETTVFQLTKTRLIDFKLEGDSDIHLVLRSTIAPNPTMIAEIPDLGCVNANADPAVAAAQQQIGAARAAFMAYLQAKGLRLQTYFQPVNYTVTVRGVGFLDFAHGQTGVAPNAIEVHPVLAFTGF